MINVEALKNIKDNEDLANISNSNSELSEEQLDNLNAGKIIEACVENPMNFIRGL